MEPSLIAQLPVGEQFWVEALKQVPALAVVMVGGLFVVFGFLRAIRRVTDDGKATVTRFLEFMDARDSRLTRRDDERDAAVRGLAESCHDFQREFAGQLRPALDRSNETLGRAADALDEREHACRTLHAELTRKLEHQHEAQMEAHRLTRHALPTFAQVVAMQRAIEKRAKDDPTATVELVVTPEPAPAVEQQSPKKNQ